MHCSQAACTRQNTMTITVTDQKTPGTTFIYVSKSSINVDFQEISRRWAPMLPSPSVLIDGFCDDLYLISFVLLAKIIAFRATSSTDAESSPAFTLFQLIHPAHSRQITNRLLSVFKSKIAAATSRAEPWVSSCNLISSRFRACQHCFIFLHFKKQ